MKTWRGLLYVKFGHIGTKSEGPDCFLQTAKQELSSQLNERHPWEADCHLEFDDRQSAAIIGD
jgi:hypothetical protein